MVRVTNTRARDWMITSFEVENPFEVPPGVEYAIWQKERCPTSGREHYQVFVRLSMRKYFTQVKEMFPPGTHIETARFGIKQCIDYCSKVESRVEGPWSVGNMPTSQKQTVIESIGCGKTVRDVLEENPSLWRSVRPMRELALVLSQPRDFMTECLFLTGMTGTGKSKIAQIISSFIGETAWLCPNMEWADGYEGQEMVIYDEVRPPLSVSRVLRMVDRYPLRLPIKGGFVNYCPRLIVMTSNVELRELFKDLDGKSYTALKRRINELSVY